MRNLIVVIAVIIAAASCLIAYNFNKKSSKAGNALNDERYARMTIEESLESAKGKIESLESELARTTNKAAGLEKKLEQVGAINKDLKGKLDTAQGRLVDLQAQVVNIKSVVQEQGETANTVIVVPVEGSGS